jgi:hypothetical protein
MLAGGSPPPWLSRLDRGLRRKTRVPWLLALTLPLYLVILAVAIHPSLAPDLGVHLKPLETEAVVVSLLLFVGINYGWLLFMEPEYPPAERDE